MLNKTYWHFASIDHNGTPHLGYDDNRKIIQGELLTVDKDIVLCRNGLHMSENILDALAYASTKSLITKVVPYGNIITSHDKIVAQGRTVVAMLDYIESSDVLQRFARHCALEVIDLWDAPSLMREYLELGSESIKAVLIKTMAAPTVDFGDEDIPTLAKEATLAVLDNPMWAAWLASKLSARIATVNDVSITSETVKRKQNIRLAKMVEFAFFREEEV